jgi:hypothetical protein
MDLSSFLVIHGFYYNVVEESFHMISLLSPVSTYGGYGLLELPIR